MDDLFSLTYTKPSIRHTDLYPQLGFYSMKEVSVLLYGCSPGFH